MEVIIQPPNMDLEKILKEDQNGTKIDIDFANNNKISEKARNCYTDENFNKTAILNNKNELNSKMENSIVINATDILNNKTSIIEDEHNNINNAIIQIPHDNNEDHKVEGETPLEQNLSVVDTTTNNKNTNNSIVVEVDEDLTYTTNSSNSNNNNNLPATIVQLQQQQKETVLTDTLASTKTSSNSTSIKYQRALVRASLLIMLFSSVLIALVALVWLFFGPIVAALLISVAGFTYLLSSGAYRWFYVAFMTLPRDLKAISRFIRLKLLTRAYEKKDLTIADIFRQNAIKYPNKVCFIYEDTEWTFTEVEQYSNKIANIFRSHGYKKGDTVALFMENKPEFVCMWLGLSKLGVIIPLINTNLRQTSLIHSFNVAKSQAIIFGAELFDAVKDIAQKLDSNVALYQLNTKLMDVSTTELKEHNLNALLKEASPEPPTLTYKVGYNDRLVYIYTSGTTGLPKAAVINNSRFVFISAGIKYVAGFTADDRLYTPLPLYHTAGGCMTIGQALLFGNTVVIRKKFSASAYFSDCRKYNCTIAQYIGEMCRYVLAVPPKPEDQQHNVRIIFGNGLRPQIWKEFVDRFNIPQVTEFYGATEGNANIVNVDNKLGAIGFVSRIAPSFYPISIIRVNEEGEPIRGSNGLCMTCKPNEPGVFIGKIIENDPSRAFLGYVDEKASEKKIVRDVFKKGDSAFLSGDILVADEFGYLFFKDRTGDTFRWKGENVSTSEVEAVVSNLINYKDAVVYGVEIHGQEGRAGMAAIYDPNNTLNLELLASGVSKELPSYARPQIIRILNKLDLTGTYKLKKVDLQKEGFNPNTISDQLYYMNSNGVYSPLTNDIYEQINTGKLRL